MTFLQLWFAVTAVFVTGFVIWAYMPVVIPLLAIAALLGGITAIIVGLANVARRHMKPRDDEPDA
jgi:hypothetical protein